MSNQLSESCNVIEECYEYMLAYAGQGVSGDSDGAIRDFLSRAARALSGLEDAYASAVPHAAPYDAFGAVLSRDASDSLAAVEL
ncbi:MAG TPA: hypothetical protein VK708_21220, partial [Bryobacteraceae bacterium]|nr:hypothetical protein [Bryobacteraceae bacterium]